VATNGRHIELNPQSPLATSELDPENILKKGKVLQGDSSSKSSGTSGNLPDSNFNTLVVVSHISHFPIDKTPLK
jgi:hypothetical protein